MPHDEMERLCGQCDGPMPEGIYCASCNETVATYDYPRGTRPAYAPPRAFVARMERLSRAVALGWAA